MNFTISETLQKQLDKVGNLSINYLDRTAGIKNGSLYTIQPTYKYLMNDKETLLDNGTYEYKTSDAVPFDCANIILLTRKKVNDIWVDDKIPAFAINFKLTEQDDSDKIKYCSMMFRGTSVFRLQDEIISAKKHGTALNRAKAFVSILKENNVEIGNFCDSLEDGKVFKFAQYKRGNNLNFVDTKYYIAEKQEEVNTSGL